jgi:hypothetical protein
MGDRIEIRVSEELSEVYKSNLINVPKEARGSSIERSIDKTAASANFLRGSSCGSLAAKSH